MAISKIEINRFEHTSDVSEKKLSDFYDERVPKTDPKFLSPVRQWEKQMGFVTPICWISLILMALYHIIPIGYLIYSINNGASVKGQTILFTMFTTILCCFGITGGAHRYWTHRSFKAKSPLKILLLLGFSMAGQHPVPFWARDHRLHHKMSDTSADPHNVKRGLFFSHMGWLIMKRHPHVIKEGMKINISDVVKDPIIRFHTKHFKMFAILFCTLLPTVIPMVCWRESWDVALAAATLRHLFVLHCTWSVNSLAHTYGYKPYNRNIQPSENWLVSLFTLGEGWHNFHHTFPWDYKTAEGPCIINATTLFLDAFAAIGWAYDLKKASPALLQAIANRD